MTFICSYLGLEEKNELAACICTELHSPKLTENGSHETSDEISGFCIDVFKISRQKLANHMIPSCCVRSSIVRETSSFVRLYIPKLVFLTTMDVAH